MRLGIRAKLFLIPLGLVAVSLATAELYLNAVLEADLTQRVGDDLSVRLRLIENEAAAFDADLRDLAEWDRLADRWARLAEGRVTILRREGSVLGDSQLEVPELVRADDHSERPELVQAYATGRGSSTRWSSTLRQRMMYVAIPLRQQGSVAGAVRLAKPLVEVDHALGHLRHFLYAALGMALAVATVLTSLASHWMSKSVRALIPVARRMAAGDLEARTGAEGHDELTELGRALDQLAHGLQSALGSLRQERDLRDRVLEGMQEGVLLLDAAGRVALTNRAFRRTLLLGADSIGKSPLELVRNAALKQVLDEAAWASVPVSAELELGDLQPRRLLVHASALPDEPRGVLAVFVDVTDLRRLESLRRDFVANVSHELRTPIASLRSAAETLRRALEVEPGSVGDFIEIIERNAQRLHHLVEDLLDLSRLEARQVVLNLEAVPVEGVVRQTLLLFRDTAEVKAVSVSTSIARDLPAVHADRRALEQILTNLIDNALKYSPRGARVTIRAERIEAGVRLVVEDTGAGIEARHLPRLFERFYRVDAGRSRELGGTGLGLSIVRHLTEAMHGRVGVESTFGRGSRFWVTLPTVPAAATTSSP